MAAVLADRGNSYTTSKSPAQSCLLFYKRHRLYLIDQLQDVKGIVLYRKSNDLGYAPEAPGLVSSFAAGPLPLAPEGRMTVVTPNPPKLFITSSLSMSCFQAPINPDLK